ncbi:hypothetical protein CIB84_014918, partial [Bambusicola thoracicus]
MVIGKGGCGKWKQSSISNTSPFPYCFTAWYERRIFDKTRQNRQELEDKATEPIRALDLTECSAVQFDYSQERVNCFCSLDPEASPDLTKSDDSLCQFCVVLPDYHWQKIQLELFIYSLVFPLRTYYLCAKTGIEADEWIKILRWKL